jgi:chromosome segregation ATPase
MQQPNSYLSPFMETVRFEVESPRGKLEAVRTENQRLYLELGNSESEKEFFRQEVQELRSQLETERASREEIEAKLSDLKKNPAPATTLSEKLAPGAATILSELARQTYRIALDKESHFHKQVIVTLPHAQKFPLLMNL